LSELCGIKKNLKEENMFIYRVIKGKKIDGVDAEKIIFETKDEKEFLEFLEKYLLLKEKIKELKNIAKESIKEREQIVKKHAYEFIYTPTTVRVFIEKDKLSDKYTLLELEYIPVKELLNQIEKKVGKKLNIDLDRKVVVSISRSRNVLHIKQYNQEKKKYLSVFTTTRYDDELLTLLKLLSELI
jgi:hypothetical protein